MIEYYPYDIESYPNIFTLSISELSTGRWWLFEISDRRNDSAAMHDFLFSLCSRVAYGQQLYMTGFNSVGYDYEVLHHFLTVLQGEAEAIDLWNKTCQIIQSDEYRPVRPSERMIPQLDLYLLHHFNNKARSTSLKMLEFQMRSHNIQDLPYEPGSYLNTEQMDNLVVYNHKDREETIKFMMESEEQINFRLELSREYERDFMNHNDTKIGKDYFIMRLEQSGYKTWVGGQLVQTLRPVIDLADAVFDYIPFSRPEFQAVKQWFQNQTITQTKGVFSDIPESQLGDVAQYAEMRKKRVRVDENYPIVHPCWEERAKTTPTRYCCYNQADNLNVVINGFKFDFGVGGIHGSIKNTIVKADNDYMIVDLDVASYYPNIAIVNKVYPEHLGELFCEIYADVYQQRKEAKKAGKDAIQAMLKLALNGVYGDSNNVYSPFYDPLYTMTITINGQLLLCSLAEKLMEIPGLSMIQINTDGLTVKLPRANKPQLDYVWNQWESFTGLQLEEAVYDLMCIRDVNNYIAVDTDGNVKRKGAYVHIAPTDKSFKSKERLGWHQNTSALIVAKAAEAYLVDGVCIRDTILNHSDIFDFMLVAKVPRTMRLVLSHNGVDEPVQRITRFYVSTAGKSMFKIMPPLKQGGDERRNSICAGWLVTECNDISNAMNPINYEYYIKEAEKLVQLS